MYISIEKQIEHCLNKISRKQHCIKMSKYGVISGPYFPAFVLNTERCAYLSVFSPNAGKYGAELTPYLDNFPVVQRIRISRTCGYWFRQVWLDLSTVSELQDVLIFVPCLVYEIWKQLKNYREHLLRVGLKEVVRSFTKLSGKHM